MVAVSAITVDGDALKEVAHTMRVEIRWTARRRK
jgi:hypothetical protein